MNGVNRGIFRLLPIFLLLFLGVSSCSQKEERRILVIHSYEETYAAYPEFNRMIAEQFEKEKIDADIRTVYLDCESYWKNRSWNECVFWLIPFRKTGGRK